MSSIAPCRCRGTLGPIVACYDNRARAIARMTISPSSRFLGPSGHRGDLQTASGGPQTLARLAACLPPGQRPEVRELG